jgi:hypothetical protein
LDQDSENGWRSDGLTITLQLLQEGVLSTPGHVHRDALAFVISTLDADDPSVRVEPKTVVASLPRLILGCDSELPRQQLDGLLQKSKAWKDHHDLKRLPALAMCLATVGGRYQQSTASCVAEVCPALGSGHKKAISHLRNR